MWGRHVTDLIIFLNLPDLSINLIRNVFISKLLYLYFLEPILIQFFSRLLTLWPISTMPESFEALPLTRAMSSFHLGLPNAYYCRPPQALTSPRSRPPTSPSCSTSAGSSAASSPELRPTLPARALPPAPSCSSPPSQWFVLYYKSRTSPS